MNHESKAKTYRVAPKVRWESAVRYFGDAKLQASTAEITLAPGEAEAIVPTLAR
jgi:hypothetical protein